MWGLPKPYDHLLRFSGAIMTNLCRPETWS